MAKLVVEKGPDKGRVVDIPDGASTSFGREDTCAVQLRDTMTSRLHFYIESREDGFYLVDRESMNGTLLNGDRVEEKLLKYGDMITAGETTMSFVSDEQAASTLTGQRVGGYRILERVGRGGMGTVYRAEQIDLQRIVALKVLSEEHIKDNNYTKLFVHEARAAAKLNHPNVVQVYDVKRHDQTFYFSMEFVGGGSVQDLLNKQRKIGYERALDMIIQSARGLEYAHKKEIIHRDIKPDNLMISEDGDIKIGDLGLARSPKENVGPDEQDTVIGTPHYIAPEQVLGRGATYKSDIYSLGATFYRMVAGITPFQAPSVRDLVNKKVREDPKPPDEHNKNVPKRISGIIMKMMERSPANRYESCTALLEDLDSYKRELKGEVQAAVGGSKPLELLKSNKKLLFGSAAAVLVVVVASVFGIAAMLGGDDKPKPDPNPPVKNTEAKKMFLNAEAFELNRMDARKADSIAKAIGMYQRVIDEDPESAFASDAEDKIAELDGKIRVLKANTALASVEQSDVERWQSMLQKLPSGTVDLTGTEATSQEYETFATDETWSGTPAAETARRRAIHIRKWQAAVERSHKKFDTIRSDADGLAGQARFRDAWTRINKFMVSVRTQAMKNSFSQSRYTSLLIGEHLASKAIRELTARAVTDLVDRRKKAETLARDKKFDEAVAELEPVADFSLSEQSREARTLIDGIQRQQMAHLREIEEARKRAEEARLKKDREEFDKISAHVWSQYLRKFDFSGALEYFRSKFTAETPEFKKRRTARIRELTDAFNYKTRLCELLGDSKAGNINRTFRIPGGGDGQIVKVSDSSLSIKLRSGGTIYEDFDNFLGRSHWKFHAWMTKAWKPKDHESDEYRRLAIVCIELGLYEEAHALIVEKMKSAEYKNNPDTKNFCDDYKARIERSNYHESREVQAEKLYMRAKHYFDETNSDDAFKEINGLRTRYGDTQYYKGHQSKIRELLRKIESMGGSSLENRRKEEAWKLIDATVRAEKNRITKESSDILKRLNRIPTEFTRQHHIGEHYAAHRNFNRSTQRLQQSRMLGDKLLASRKMKETSSRILAQVYAGLYRNYVLAGKSATATKISNESLSTFRNPDNNEVRDWWDERLRGLVYWRESIHAKVKAEGFRRALKKNPEDPKLAWDLAEALHIAEYRLPDAAGYYQHIIDQHSDFHHVKSGEVFYRLAEIYYALRDVEKAADLYNQVAKKFPEHARVKDDGSSGVKSRWNNCMGLLRDMGYLEEKKRGRRRGDK